MKPPAKLKIAFVAGTLGQGGAERQLFLHCRELKQIGAEIEVLCLTKGEFWEAKIRALDIPVIWVGKSHNKLRRIWAIRRELKRMRPSLCQSQHFFTNLYVTLACKGLGIRDVGAVRSNIHQEMARRNKLICQWSLQWPSLVLANSEEAILTGSKYGQSADHFRYLPNIVETTQYHQAQPSEKNDYRILGVGRLVALKHWPVFLQVIADLRHQGHQVQGQLVGDGPQREYLKELAAKLSLDDTALHFVGAVADVRHYYAKADLLLATSSLEGMPNVVMEAMASGLPVVTTRVGGVPHLIEHGENGFLTEVDATPSLREHCGKLLNDLALRQRVGQAARVSIEQKHSPNAVRPYLLKLYEDILD